MKLKIVVEIKLSVLFEIAAYLKRDRLAELTRASEFISTSFFGDKHSDGSRCVDSSSGGGII